MRDIESRNRLVVEYKYIADMIAQRRKMSCVKSIQLSELQSAAYMGLIDAANKFDEKKGSFKVYAKYRIHGEINDFLRKYSGTRRSKLLKCWSLDIPVYTSNFTQTSPLGDSLSTNDVNLSQVDNDDAFRKITSCLSKVQKQVIYLYYIKNINMKEIGNRIGICESRVSQIAAEARNKIKELYDVRQEDLFDIPSSQKVNFVSYIKNSKE